MQYNIIARKVRVRTYVGDEVVRCTCSGAEQLAVTVRTGWLRRSTDQPTISPKKPFLVCTVTQAKGRPCSFVHHSLPPSLSISSRFGCGWPFSCVLSPTHRSAGHLGIRTPCSSLHAAFLVWKRHAAFLVWKRHVLSLLGGLLLVQVATDDNGQDKDSDTAGKDVSHAAQIGLIFSTNWSCSGLRRGGWAALGSWKRRGGWGRGGGNRIDDVLQFSHGFRAGRAPDERRAGGRTDIMRCGGINAVRCHHHLHFSVSRMAQLPCWSGEGRRSGRQACCPARPPETRTSQYHHREGRCRPSCHPECTRGPR
eukprot:scaffold5366_cov128-Isochrysis_galbana.AAC.3